jgi:hypothetical protein
VVLVSTARKNRKQSFKTSKRGGKGLAWVGMLIGFSVSVAFNIADEFVRTTQPDFGALFLGFFWPFTLLFATEVMARIDWPKHWVWVVVRVAGLAPVALVAAWLSYWHLEHVISHYGEQSFSAHIAPFAIDGLMLMCSAALLAPAAVAKAATRVPAPAPAVEPAVPARQRPDVTDLIPIGEAVLATLERKSKTAFGAALREQGVKAGKDKVSALYDHLVTA